MQTLKNIIRKLCRPVLLALLGVACFAPDSQASRIDFKVFARGRWVLLVPGSNTGGRIVYSATYGCEITDRAARGEALQVIYSATFPGEYTCDSGGYYTCLERYYGAIPLPYVHHTSVSTNPNCDYLHYWIWTNCDYDDRRVPIGARP